MSNNNNGGKFRKKATKFTQMSNNVIRDKTLSFKAKGLYCLIQSYITLENFDIYKGFLMKQCVEGEKAFNTAWKELKDHGYLKQYRIPTGNKGTFTYEYDLLDEANLLIPSLINCDKNGNPITKDKSEKNHIPQNGGSGDHTPQNVPNGKSTICDEYPVDNGGDINNTDFNNTDFNNTDHKTDVTIAEKIFNSLSKTNIAISKEEIETIINEIKQKQDLSAVKNIPAYLTSCVKNYLIENEFKNSNSNLDDKFANFSFTLQDVNTLICGK